MRKWTMLLLSTVGLQSAFCAAPPPPNILLIFADDIGYEALGCYGGKDFSTPRLDRMAAEGLRFSRAYTSPVCTPSRVSLHTGLRTSAHRFTSVLPVHLGTSKKVDFLQLPTFAQQLRACGYATSTTGKWQLATLEQHPNHLREAGFNSWCIWQIWLAGAKTGRYWLPTLNQDGLVREDVADRFGPDVITQYVIDQMTAARDAGKPFLIVHNELLPHEPIVRTPTDEALNRPASLGNMINHMDSLVGQVLDAVEALGIRDNTYVFFMGDNGTEANHFRVRHTTRGEVHGGKRDMNDAGTHVALLAWGPPSLPQNKVCDDLVEVTDLFPTFCALAQAPIPASLAGTLPGRSLVPQLQGREGEGHRWTHQGVGGIESVFDGAWRMHNDGRLIDARKLPAEVPAGNSPAATEAKARLAPLFRRVRKAQSVKVPGQVVDNKDARAVRFTGEWKLNHVSSGFYGIDYAHDLNEGKGSKAAHFRLPISTSGVHEVYLHWNAHVNRASNVPITIVTENGPHRLSVNQRKNGGRWNSLGQFSFKVGSSAILRIETAGTDGYVVADAVCVRPVEQ